MVCAAIGAAACSADLPRWDGSGWRVASTPSDGANGVDRQGLITLQLERLPLPNTVTSATVRLHSAMVQANYEIRVQPVTREIWLLLQTPLESEITY
ncbi:MAG TPA: hypothetical protein VHZ95_21300, partial [Polyangiales bacterium]|nr:hypothetical protein [Polyangiales bacterium]